MIIPAIIVLAIGALLLLGSSATDSLTPPSALIGSWASAIYDFEDPKKTGPATRNNNPGNIEDSSGNKVVYGSMAEGWVALYSDLSAKIAKYPNFTFDQIMSRYADGVSDGSTTTGGLSYAKFVVGRINNDFGTDYDPAVETISDASNDLTTGA